MFSVTLLFLSVAFASQVSYNSAVYTVTNDPAGNSVLIYSVTSDGTVTYSGQESTGGDGGGNPGTQSSLVVVNDSLLVLDGGTGQVVYFKINTSNPTQIWNKDSQSTSGSWPVSITATTAWGGRAFAVSGKDDLVITSLYWSDTTIYANSTNERTLGVNLNGSAVGSVSQIAISPNNDYLVVQFKGLSWLGAIVYTIATDGTLSATGTMYPASAPLGPKSFGFNFVTDTWIITTDAADGVLLYSLKNGAVVNASVTSISPPGTQAYCWIGWDGWYSKHFYGIAAHTGNITEISVDTTAWTLKAVNTWTGPWIPLTDVVSVGLTDMKGELLVLAPKNGLTYWPNGGADMLSQGGVVAFPSGVNVSAVAGLASYSMSWTKTSSGYVVGLSSFTMVLLLLCNLVQAWM